MITAPIAALAAALALTPVMIRIARRLRWVAQPSEERWHRVPTALMGGTAIFTATSLGWALLPRSNPLIAIWLGGALLALAGFIDDRWHLSLAAKLAVQLAGAAILVWSGLLLVPAWPLWLSLPLTLFWVVGITNAVNLLDNMDGLAAGISAIAAVTLGILALGNGDAVMAIAAFVLAAAALGFLAYNYNPAKTFMGDTGSLFLGFTLSGFALAAPSAGSGRGLTALLLVPAAVLAVPIFDTTLVTAKRLIVGRSVGQGGRDHSSHRLVTLGLTERGAVLTLYGIAAGFGLIAVALQRVQIELSLALLIYATIALAAFGVFLASLQVYDPETEARGRLRADGRGPGDPALLRAAFRHKHVIAAFVTASLAAIALLLVLFSLQDLSRFALIIVAVLATAAIAGARLSFRFFRTLYARLSPPTELAEQRIEGGGAHASAH